MVHTAIYFKFNCKRTCYTAFHKLHYQLHHTACLKMLHNPQFCILKMQKQRDVKTHIYTLHKYAHLNIKWQKIDSSYTADTRGILKTTCLYFIISMTSRASCFVASSRSSIRALAFTLQSQMYEQYQYLKIYNTVYHFNDIF